MRAAYPTTNCYSLCFYLKVIEAKRVLCHHFCKQVFFLQEFKPQCFVSEAGEVEKSELLLLFEDPCNFSSVNNSPAKGAEMKMRGILFFIPSF